MNIDELRQHYLGQAPYHFDVTIIEDIEDIFTADEIAGINKYGYWFEAIWSGKVPLTTDKLKRFSKAKEINPSDRTKWEELWVRYDGAARLPF